MLRFSDSFRTPRLSDVSVKDIRVLGITHDKMLLILTQTENTSSIEKVSSDGNAITVIVFNQKLDIINACLSFDNEICHITQRIQNGKSFKFISTFYSIFQSFKSSDITADVPIDGFFLPYSKNDSTYQMLHIIGNRITHLKVTLMKKHISIEKQRGGINIQNIVSYYYDRDRQTLSIIYRQQNEPQLSVFGFTNQSVQDIAKFNVFLMHTTTLPYDVSLCPMTQKNLSYYHQTPNRIFIFNNNKKTLLIQQLYTEEYQHLSFCVSSYPDAFNQIIQVPYVLADIPLCFANFNSIVIVYIPNAYFCMIDTDVRPALVTVLPKALADSICSFESVSLPLKNTLIDMESKRIHKVEIDFAELSKHKDIIDDGVLYTFALFINNNLVPEYLADLFELLRELDDKHRTQVFFQNLFHKLAMPTRGIKPQKSRSHRTLAQMCKGIERSGDIKKRIVKFPKEVREKVEQIELEFPSCGAISRRQAFRITVKALHDKKKWRETEKNAQKAIKFLEKQNIAANVIREALDIYEKKYKSNELWLLTLKIIIATEAAFISFPKIPELSKELASLGFSMCSKAMRQKLESARVMDPLEQSTEEVTYWKEKMNLADTDDFSDSNSDSTPYSSPSLSALSEML